MAGLDTSAGMIAEASRNALQAGWGDVRFQVSPAPFLDIPFPDGSFDAVGSTQAFHHLHERHKPAALREMARVLRSSDPNRGRPGGRLALGDVMFQNQAHLQAALARWSGELEEEYFACLEILGPMFAAAGLTFHAEQISRINWVVWGSK